MYSFLLTKRAYNLSDIVFSNEKIEEFYTDYGDGNVSSSWDKVTTFYDKQGKSYLNLVWLMITFSCWQKK